MIGSTLDILIYFLALENTDDVLSEIEFGVEYEEWYQNVEESIAANRNVRRFLEFDGIFCEVSADAENN